MLIICVCVLYILFVHVLLFTLPLLFMCVSLFYVAVLDVVRWVYYLSLTVLCFVCNAFACLSHVYSIFLFVCLRVASLYLLLCWFMLAVVCVCACSNSPCVLFIRLCCSLFSVFATARPCLSVLYS